MERRYTLDQQKREAKGPLKGLKILDLGLAGAGPMGPTFLAEWGAEVTKVELPEIGNIFRRIPPLYNGQSFWFPIEARHKKSLTVDMHTDKGQEAIKRLVKDFDLVLENYRPGTLERWNLSYDDLKEAKDDIILIRVSGFGQEGPYRRRTSYDTVGAAMGGVYHLTGHPEHPPALVGTGMCDYLTAAFNALASLIAIYHRNKTGKGQWADIPQYEAIFRLCEFTAAAYDKLGIVRERTGNRHPSIAPSDLYLTKDKQWVAIEAFNDRIFTRLAQAMGRDELVDDPRFKTAAGRAENSDAINGMVASWVGGKNLKEVVDMLVEARVPVSPVYSTKEILEDPHFKTRKSLIEMEDPVMGKLTLQNLVGRFSRTPSEIRDTGARLGEHNDEILRQWLRYGEEEIAAIMGKKGQIAVAPQRDIKEDKEEEIKGEDFPLKGIKVLDLGCGLAGSFAATLLADFGAEVIKVEEPGVGDDLRHLPPFFKGVSLWWGVDARNKKSITLDIRKEKGRELLKRLVNSSDIVIESFRPGTLEEWGLSYEELKKVNKGLIMLRASSFGQDGPYSHRLAGEAVASAISGFTFVNGFPDSPPVRAGYSFVNYTAGVFGAMAIIAAVLERDQSGEGQWVDLALYEPMLRLSHENIPVYDKLGELRSRTGNRFSNTGAPIGLYETKDGRWVAILAPEDKDFGRIVRAMGREEMAKDPRYATLLARKENGDMINEAVSHWVKGYSYKEIQEILESYEVPYSLVYDIKDIFEDPHYQTRRNIIEVEDPAMGTVKMQDVVPKLSLSPGQVKTTGPSLGQHNREILEALLGCSEEELSLLKAEKII